MLARSFLLGFADFIFTINELTGEARVFRDEEALSELHIVEDLFVEVFDLTPTIIGEAFAFGDLLFSKLHK